MKWIKAEKERMAVSQALSFVPKSAEPHFTKEVDADGQHQIYIDINLYSYILSKLPGASKSYPFNELTGVNVDEKEEFLKLVRMMRDKLSDTDYTVVGQPYSGYSGQDSHALIFVSR